MDTNDPLSNPRIRQILEKSHMYTMLAGRKFREVIISRFMSQLHTKKDQDPDSANPQCLIPSPYHPCIARFTDLEKIMLKDLRTETHHRGFYIVLRSITPPDTSSAVSAIVEDENEDIITVQLFHQEASRAHEHGFGTGSIFIVKEPYLKLMDDGQCGIRVDHPSDVKYLSAGDERTPERWRLLRTEQVSPGTWNARGNGFIDKSEYRSAIECYSTGLELSPTKSEAQTLRLNRCLAFLKINLFEDALADLEPMPADSKAYEKALYRESQALYGLHRYQECYSVLRVCRKEYPQNLEAESLFTQVIKRLLEQKTGKYQFKQMQLEAEQLRPPHVDHATYIGPVTIRLTESRGRGLFTTQAVKAGDLLLCEKAFAYAFLETGETSEEYHATQEIKTEAEIHVKDRHKELIRAAVQKLHQSPSEFRVISDLYHGSYKPVDVSLVDGLPIFDTFLIQRTVALNAFKCPISSREYHKWASKDEETREPEGFLNGWFGSGGIWHTASHVNHACKGNTWRSFIGDLIILRAADNLPPDTELTICYLSPANDYEKDAVEFDHWGFACNCVICQDLRTTDNDVLAERAKIANDLTVFLEKCETFDIARVDTDLAKLAKTYQRPATETPRLSLWMLYVPLAKFYARTGWPLNTIDSSLKALESIGYVIHGGRPSQYADADLVVKQWGLMTDMIVEVWVMLSRAYQKFAPKLAVQAQEHAKLAYRICVGEDETFEETYLKAQGSPDDVVSGLQALQTA